MTDIDTRILRWLGFTPGQLHWLASEYVKRTGSPLSDIPGAGPSPSMMHPELTDRQILWLRDDYMKRTHLPALTVPEFGANIVVGQLARFYDIAADQFLEGEVLGPATLRGRDAIILKVGHALHAADPEGVKMIGTADDRAA